MNIETMVAIAALTFTVLSAIVGGAFILGKHSQRIATLEDKTQDIGSLAVLASNLSGLKGQIERLEDAWSKRVEHLETAWSQRVDRLEQDLRELLGGRNRSPTQRGQN